MKYYSGYGYDEVYPLSWWHEIAYDNQEEIILEEQKRDIGSGVMWCKLDGDFVDSGDGVCGKDCLDYRPCNGKSGRCRELEYTFIGTDRFVKITPHGAVIRVTNDKG